MTIGCAYSRNLNVEAAGLAALQLKHKILELSNTLAVKKTRIVR